MPHTAESLIDECERFQLASFGSTKDDSAKLRGVWNTLGARIRSTVTSGKTFVVPGFARVGVNLDTGEGSFGLMEDFASRFGIRCIRPRSVRQGPDRAVNYMDLASASGASKDAVQAGLKELFTKVGEYAGRKREQVTLRFPGVGSLSITGGNAVFNFEAPFRGKAGSTTKSAAVPSGGLSTARSLASHRSSSSLHHAGRSMSRSGPLAVTSSTAGLRRSGRAPPRPQASSTEVRAFNQAEAERKRLEESAARTAAAREAAHTLRDAGKYFRETSKSAAAHRAQEQAIADEMREIAERKAEEARYERLHATPETERWVFTDPETVRREQAESKRRYKESLDEQLGGGPSVKPPKRLGADGGIAPAEPVYPVFLRPSEPPKARVHPGQAKAVKIAQRQAEKLYAQQLAQKRQAIKAKEAEIAAVTKRAEEEEARKARHLKRAQLKQNLALAEQLVAREEARMAERAREVEEPDPSHVHPLQPIADTAKVKKEKERLRLVLEEQVALKAARRAAERDMEIKQDRVFLESVFQEIHEDRRKKHTVGSSTNKEFQEGWKRHHDLKRMEEKLDRRMIS